MLALSRRHFLIKMRGVFSADVIALHASIEPLSWSLHET